ncbi:MAG: hypothetical protein CL670_04755 [Balneola sp.]|jgi:hypothetical protein|nr:hypothetical protein [Balneola sp.]MBE78441.1 hypothetical protein [Balneola sp.]|tara:strand:+ start:715 stop:1368 length:654 start_codon:yes stop_codon:yes gene_type:complete
MEKETKVLLGAVIAAPLAYVIPLSMGNIWLAYFLLLCVVVAFLGSLIMFASDELDSRNYKRIFIGVTCTLIVINMLLFTHDYSRKDYQKSLLLEIRKIIDEGVTKNDVQKDLTHIFARYHSEDRDSIVKTARELIPEKLGENGIYISNFDLEEDTVRDDNTNFFYEIDEEADELSIIVVTDISLGEQPGFENYDGQAGRFEMEFTLNKEGVEYEVRN